MVVSGQHRDPAALFPIRNVGTRWVGSRAGVDVLERGKISWSFHVLNPGPSSAWRNHCTDCAIQAPNIDVEMDHREMDCWFLSCARWIQSVCLYICNIRLISFSHLRLSPLHNNNNNNNNNNRSSYTLALHLWVIHFRHVLRACSVLRSNIMFCRCQTWRTAASKCCFTTRRQNWNTKVIIPFLLALLWYGN
jgi:hypothetical protein